MSRSTSATEDVLRLESSLEALQQSAEFRGPVEPMDGHTCNDHFALIYETEAEQLAAAIPFLRQGLERGERCIYVVDGEARVSRIRSAMREAGIEPDERERIFDVFEGLHGREQYSGTGIGLALCERIVECHGGEIWVDSEPAEGATFSVSLPAAN